MTTDLLRTLKRAGFSDADIAGVLRRGRERWCASAGSRTGWWPPTSASTPARPSSSRSRRTCTAASSRCARPSPRREEEGHHPRQRPQPHRPGHRVRLLLLPRRLRLPRGRLRDGDGELQPRDRLHRLRHRRSPVLRAADVRGRDGDRGARAQRRRPSVVVRGAVRRPDAAQAGAGAAGGRRADPGHDAGLDRPGRGSQALLRSCCATSACRSPPAARRCRASRRAKRPTGSAIRWSCGRPTCSAAGAWRSCSTPARSTST